MKTAPYILVTILLGLPGVAMATEEPSYTVLLHKENFELRRYDGQIVAQTWVTGDQDTASRQGFKILADYIFGNNKTASGNSSTISMTTPVMMQHKSDHNGTNKSESSKIAMTAPVMMKQENNKWRMQFIMPSHYTMQTLPKPNNPAVTIAEIPVKSYAVVTFSGLAGPQKVEVKTKELRLWMRNQQLEATAVPELARYNPPWTLPFMRRNEIMIAYQQ